MDYNCWWRGWTWWPVLTGHFFWHHGDHHHINFVIVTSQWRHHIWNHGLLYCFSNTLFGLASKKASKLNITNLCETNPMKTVWFPYKKAVIECTHTLMTLWYRCRRPVLEYRGIMNASEWSPALRRLGLLSCFRHTIDLEPVAPREHLWNLVLDSGKGQYAI